LKSKTPAVNSLDVPANIPCGAEQQELVDAHFRSHATQWREVYDEASVEGAIYRERLATVLGWVDELPLSPGEQVLEIGCGGGASTVALAQRGHLVQAIDSVANMLNSTRQCAADAGVSSSVFTNQGDAHNLAFPESAFGLVLAIGVIPYLHSPKKALGEMARVLKPGGYLLVTQSNRWRLNNVLDPWLWPPVQAGRRMVRAILRRLRESWPEPSSAPLRFGSPRELDHWLSSAGLTKVKAKTVGFSPLTFRSRPLLGELTSVRLNRSLQWLADHNVLGIRSSGKDYVVLARKNQG
jgi:ubiquinone/menaquinone biosynthesis C-methylase UbiE